jgi:hypothetical protein
MAQSYGIIQCALLVATMGMLALRAGTRPPFFRITLLALSVAAALLPTQGLPLSGYLLGLCGEFSITSLLLLMGILLRQLTGTRVSWGPDVRVALIAVALAGLFLYPAATGLLPMDPYRLGYRPAAMLIALAALAVWAWAAGRRAAAVLPLLAVAAFDFRIMESSNLWDYLIDPFVTLCAWAWVVAATVRRIRKGPAQ